MAIFLNKECVSVNNTTVPVVVENVSSLPTTGSSDRLYHVTITGGANPEGFYYWDGVSYKTLSSEVSGQGTSNYNELSNKPRINGVVLQGSLTLLQLDIAQASLTYTKNEVDALIAASQKVYVTSMIPTAESNVGLYYYDLSMIGDTGYRLYLVDANKTVTDLGGGDMSLSGYQKINDPMLATDDKSVPGAINELKTRIDNLNFDVDPIDITGTNGIQVDRDTDGNFVVSHTSDYMGQVNQNINDTPVALSFGDTFYSNEWKVDTYGHAKDKGTKIFTLPNFSLNGVNQGKTVSFYAPTDSGVKDQVLVSQGTGKAPIWKTPEEQKVDTIPVGCIMPFAGSVLPDGWLECNGDTFYFKSAETGADTIYTPLYNVIGTTYGVGTMAGTFKVPDLRQKFIEGASTTSGHTLGSSVEAGLPDHNHTVTLNSHTHSFNSGTFNAITGYIDTNDNRDWSGTPSGCFTGKSAGSCKKYAGSLDGTGTRYTFSATPSYQTNKSPYVDSKTATGSIDKASAHNDVYGKSSTVQPASICMKYMIKY